MDTTAVQGVRLAYDAINDRDVDALVDRLDTAVELRMPMDPLRVHPAFYGPDGARAFYGILFGVFELYRVDLQILQELGRDVVVAIGRLVLRARGEAAERSIRFSHFWEVRDGVATHVSFHDAENPLVMIDSGRSLALAA